MDFNLGVFCIDQPKMVDYYSYQDNTKFYDILEKFLQNNKGFTIETIEKLNLNEFPVPIHNP
jgi:hypothetical protein